MTPRIVGLDLSLTSTGWANEWKTGTIKSKQDGAPRLAEIRNAVLQVVYDAEAELVVIEGYSFNSRQGGERIGELGGVIRVALFGNKVPYIEIAPSARAQYATGSGRASKDRVVAAIAARTGIAFRNSDECDAWILRAMALDHYGAPIVRMPETHRTALAKPAWPDLVTGVAS